MNDISVDKFPVFSMKVAAKLMLLGHKPQIEENYQFPQYYVFKFNKNEKFLRDLEIVQSENELN